MGTDPTNPDSDSDLLPDHVEAQGFVVGAQKWYSHPLLADSNNDGMPDGLECPDRSYTGSWDTYAYDTRNPASTPCHDTDSDGTPDVFDDDNDGDGVPDNVDVSPASKLAQADRFSLVVNDLAGDEPVFVNLQLAPVDQNHLWYAFNVLDWPSGDEDGQLQRANGNDSTYASKYGTGDTEPRSGYGDMRLVPMLEIEIPWDPGHFGNLPVLPGAPTVITYTTPITAWLDTAKLESYGVAVKQKDDHGTLLAYVPLNVVNDQSGGTRVAFSARMPYWPTTPQWGQAHQIRLVWLVRALTDFRCAPQGGDPDCNADSWSLDHDQIVQTYYENFTLTGLSVREDYGTDMTVLFENPAVDDQPGLDDRLWALADNLELTFIGARDANGNHQRDLTVAEIARRFDLHSTVTDAERWGIPAGEIEAVRYTFAHQDLIATMVSTNTEQILDTYFLQAGQPRAQLPTLLFVREETSRSANLDYGARVRGTGLTLDVAAQPQTLGVLQWRPYQYENGRWKTADLQNYLDVMGLALKQDPISPFFQAESASADDAELLELKLSIAKSYYASLVQGFSSVLQMGVQVLSQETNSAIDDNALLTRGIQLGKKYAGYPSTVVKISLMVKTMLENRSQAKYFTQLVKASTAAWGASEQSGGLRRMAAQAGSALKQGVQRIGTTWSNLGGRAKFFSVAGGIAAVAGLTVGIYFLLSSDRSTANKIQIVMGCVGVLTSAIGLATSVYKIAIAAGASLFEKMFMAYEGVTSAARSAAIVGAIIAVGITFGLFIYSMISAGVKFGSLEFDAALATTIGTAVALVIMIAIAFIPVVGQIIAAVLALIDGIIALVCALEGKDADDSWVCNGITGYLAKGIAWVIYGQSTLIDLDADDRLQTHHFGMNLASGSNGFSVGSGLHFNLGVTTTIQLADAPDDWKALAYFWQWTDERAESSAFRYSLEGGEQDVDVARGDTTWTSSDGSHVTTRRVTTTTPIRLTQASINVPVNGLYLNEGYAVPVQECWAIPTVPFFWPLIPVCYIRDQEDTNNLNVGKNIRYDVFPATLAGFYSLASTGNGGGAEGGYTLSWGHNVSGTLTIPRLKDADGDGLLNKVDLGSDPNDSTWDTDGDGLSDPFELNKGTDPDLADSDFDGLGDQEELFWGTNPHLADSDGDGLNDLKETQGWDFVYGYQDGAPLVTHIVSDPLDVDADGDGYTDAQEKIYGFNPNVASSSNILTFDAEVLELGAGGTYTTTDGYVRPGETLFYQANVVNELDARYAQGLLDTDFPAAVQGSLTPQTFVLHPQQQITLTGNVQVAPLASSGLVTLTQVAEARITDPSQLLEDPRVWLKFDETSGATTFVDSAGVQPAYNASCSSGACPTTGVVGEVGKSLLFPSTAHSYVTLANASNLGLTNGDFTIAMQIRPRFQSASNTNVIFASRKTGSATPGLVLGFSAAKPYMAFYQNGTQLGRVDTNVTLAERPWYDLAFRYKHDSGEMAIFVNGALVQIQQGIPPFQEDGLVYIGGLSGDNSSFYPGNLDNLRIYSQALSDRNISNLVKRPILAIGFDLATYKDESDHANSVWCTKCPTLVDGGISGKAAQFDGTNSVAAQGTALGLYDQFTQAAWVYPTDTGSASAQTVMGGDPYPYIKVVGRKVMVGWYSDVSYTIPNDALTGNAWNHVAATFKEGDYRVYVNGIEVGNTNTGSKRPSFSYEVLIGYNSLRGKVDDVAIYAEGFTAEDVNALYLAGALAMHLRLDDPPGGIQFDGQRSILRNEIDLTGQSNGVCLAGQCPTLGVAGRDERAALFDGSHDFITLQTSAASLAYSGNTPYSLSAWVNPQGAAQIMTVIGKIDMMHEGAYYLRIEGDRRLLFHREVYGGCDLYSAQSISFNQWSHVVATYDGATMRLYVDGALSNSLACSGSQDAAPNTAVTIGAHPHSHSPAFFFHGQMDDARIYHRALTSDEVAVLHTAMPAMQMHLDEAQGALTFGDSAAGAQVACSGEACPSPGLKGQVGLAASFAGDDVLSLPNSAARLSFGGSKPFSLMAWVKPRSGGVIVGKFNTGVSGEYFIKVVDDGRVQFHREVSPYNIYTTQVIPFDTWSHIAATYDGATMRIYLNGIVAVSSNVGAMATDTATPATVGALYDHSHLSDFFEGALDEVVVYSHALSSFEVYDAYTSQAALVEDRQQTSLTVDAAAPVSSLVSDHPYRANQDTQLFISAADATSGIGKVEWSANGAWAEATPCLRSAGFCPTFHLAGEGRYVLQTRATDWVGNVETPAGQVTFYVDATAPQITLDLADSATVSLQPHPSDPTAWILPLSGAVSDPSLSSGDPGSGVAQVTVIVLNAAGKDSFKNNLSISSELIHAA